MTTSLMPASRPITADERRRTQRVPHVLDPDTLGDHIDSLYRAAWSLCGSRTEAQDLVQATFVHVLKRPRVIRANNERGYLLRALRNTYSTRHRTLARRPATVPLNEEQADQREDSASISAHELMEAIATAPPRYRDAVVAVDVLGLSYREAADSLRTREETLATRLHRGRQHVAGELIARGA